MDGTGVPMRKAELVGRAGKQPDGSAKTREVKLVTVWSAEGRDEEGTPVRDGVGQLLGGHRERSAEGHRRGAQRVRGARRARGHPARLRARPRQVVLGDGRQVDLEPRHEHFPDAIQIVDRFHAKQHLSDVAKSIYGTDSDLGKQWAQNATMS